MRLQVRDVPQLPASSTIIGGTELRADMHLPNPDEPFAGSLHGRVVVVTGATGGLGRALALGCAAHGATVVLHGRVVRKLEALFDEIVAAGYPEPSILPLDLATAKAEDFANVASALQAQSRRVDALVHAGRRSCARPA